MLDGNAMKPPPRRCSHHNGLNIYALHLAALDRFSHACSYMYFAAMHPHTLLARDVGQVRDCRPTSSKFQRCWLKIFIRRGIYV